MSQSFVVFPKGFFFVHSLQMFLQTLISSDTAQAKDVSLEIKGQKKEAAILTYFRNCIET